MTSSLPPMQTVTTGFAVAVVGFFSSFPIILQALHAVGADGPQAASGLMAAAAGLAIATAIGGEAIGLLLSGYDAPEQKAGLPHGGRLIGLLERSMIFLLILVGQPAGVGFLIAAKSILRFEETRDSNIASEYIIIGTLASFAWAMACAWATLALIDVLPPIGIPTETP